MQHASKLLNGPCHSHAAVLPPSVVSPPHALLPSGPGGRYLYTQPVRVPPARIPSRLSKPSSDRWASPRYPSDTGMLTQTLLPHMATPGPEQRVSCQLGWAGSLLRLSVGAGERDVYIHVNVRYIQALQLKPIRWIWCLWGNSHTDQLITEKDFNTWNGYAASVERCSTCTSISLVAMYSTFIDASIHCFLMREQFQWW